MTYRGPVKEREPEYREERRVREETSHDVMDHGEDRREETRITEEPGRATSERVTHDRAEEQRLQFFRLRQIIWTFMGILLGFLALRFVLMLLGASPEAPFAALVYSLTNPFVSPFQGVLGQPQTNGMVLETATLVAMAVYALITWAIVRLLWIAGFRTSARTVSRTTRDDHRPEDDRITRR